jgi:AI-2E family transporter
MKLFRLESREAVYATLSGIGSMFRAFAVGNALCGLFMSLVSVAAFGLLGLPYFYFLGFISGFLSLIPYLGVALAVVPPITVGLSEVSGPRLLAVFVIIVGLHLFTINVLFSKSHRKASASQSADRDDWPICVELDLGCDGPDPRCSYHGSNEDHFRSCRWTAAFWCVDGGMKKLVKTRLISPSAIT